MSEVWLYTVGVNTDPDCVHCKVPFPANNEFIFFGPCMRRIREKLRRLYLDPDKHRHVMRMDHVIVGVNAGYENEQGNRIRKIIWAGKLIEVMTFAEAHERLAAARFQNLRKDPESPLLVRPQFEKGILVGYKHVSQLHEENENAKPHKKWVYDLTSDPKALGVRVIGNQIRLDGVSAWDGFDRDCCMLLKRISFAKGRERGIKIEGTALAILRKEQPGRGVNEYAIFGKTANGKVNGLRNNYRTLKGKQAERFIAWLSERARKARKRSHYGLLPSGHARRTGNARLSCRV